MTTRRKVRSDRYWTPGRVRRLIVKRIEQGFTIKQVSEVVGVSPTRISTLLKSIKYVKPEDIMIDWVALVDSDLSSEVN